MRPGDLLREQGDWKHPVEVRFVRFGVSRRSDERGGVQWTEVVFLRNVANGQVVELPSGYLDAFAPVSPS